MLEDSKPSRMEHAIEQSDGNWSHSNGENHGDYSPSLSRQTSGSNGNVELTDASEWPQRPTVEERPDRPSNEALLSTAFISFMSFALCQTVAAVIAKSEAMLGDSAAMFVDALTYLFNYVAERKKNSFDNEYHIPLTSPHDRRLKQRARRKMTLTMELVPPLISVTTLIIVTAFVLRKAIHVLILDIHRNPSQQGNPNIKLMLCFSSINLGLDFVNVFCFAKAKHLMGYDTDVTHETHTRKDHRNYANLERNDSLEDGSSPAHLDGNTQDNGNGHRLAQTDTERGNMGVNGEAGGVPLTADMTDMPIVQPQSCDSCHDENESEGANLNMCSAYTHVFADTLRSIAVIIAAVIAEVVDGVTPEEADATAAVVVSILILLSLIPLFQGLLLTFSELRALRAEEKSDTVFAVAEVATNGDDDNEPRIV